MRDVRRRTANQAIVIQIQERIPWLGMAIAQPPPDASKDGPIPPSERSIELSGAASTPEPPSAAAESRQLEPTCKLTVCQLSGQSDAAGVARPHSVRPHRLSNRSIGSKVAPESSERPSEKPASF